MTLKICEMETKIRNSNNPVFIENMKSIKQQLTNIKAKFKYPN